MSTAPSTSVAPSAEYLRSRRRRLVGRAVAPSSEFMDRGLLRQIATLLQCMIGIVRHEHESFSTEPRELRAPARANEPQLAARVALAVGRAKRHGCGGPSWRDAIGDEPEPRPTPRVV